MEETNLMSEYQYYEFMAIDKPLTEAEQSKMRKISSRAQVTSKNASFVYNYKDFPGNAEKILEQHFDAMLYVSNFGDRKLMFKFPSNIINLDLLKPYTIPYMVSASVKNDSVILDIDWNDEEGGGDWIEGEGWLPSLALLRQDVMKKDFRLPYLAWLKAAAEDEHDDYQDLTEPSVPNNLHDLSTSLKDFVELFEINKHLLKAAALNSQKGNTLIENNLEKCITQLSPGERDNFLIRLAKGEPNVDVHLINRLHELAEKTDCQSAAPRTVAEIKKDSSKRS